MHPQRQHRKIAGCKAVHAIVRHKCLPCGRIGDIRQSSTTETRAGWSQKVSHYQLINQIALKW